MKVSETAAIGIVTVSDRASAGTCSGISGPAIEEFPSDVLVDLANREKCALIFTTLRHAIDAGSHHRRVPAADVGIWRTDAYRKPETSADVDPVAADRRHSRVHVDRQSDWTARIVPGQHASNVPSDPMP